MKLPAEFEELKVIGARIRQERQKRNLDQAGLGKLAGGINKETIGRLETGRNSTLETLCAVCRALDLELADLLADHVPAFGLPLSKKHSRLHSRFQAILDAGNRWEECITLSVNAIYRELLATQVFRPVPSRKKAREEERHPSREEAARRSKIGTG